MNIGSPERGIHFQQASSVVTPIDPLTVAGVIRVMYYRSPYPKTLDSYLGTTATPGDSVLYVADRQAVAGGDPFDNQSVPLNAPTMRADGLEFSTDINDKLSMTNIPINAGLTSFTMYLWGTQIDNNDSWIPIGNTNDQTFVLVGGNTLNVSDDSGNIFSGSSDVPGGKILVRLDYDTNTLNAQYTGNPTGFSVSNSGLTFTFNCAGQAPNIGNPNADTGNRQLGQIIVPKNTLGSATDLGLRQWIINLDGAAYAF